MNRFSLISQLFVNLSVLSVRPKMSPVRLIEQGTEQIALVIADMLGFDSNIKSCTSIVLLGCLISLAHFCDWSYLIPAWTIIFFCYYKRDTKKMIVLFALASVTLQTLLYLKEFDSFALFSFQYGTLLALVPISMYNGERGNVRHKNLNRWFFYVYYPAHMVALMAVKALLQ